jgi:hypothetical protein
MEIAFGLAAIPFLHMHVFSRRVNNTTMIQQPMVLFNVIYARSSCTKHGDRIAEKERILTEEEMTVAKLLVRCLENDIDHN